MDDSVTTRLNCTIDYIVICRDSYRLRLSLKWRLEQFLECFYESGRSRKI